MPVLLVGRFVEVERVQSELTGCAMKDTSREQSGGATHAPDPKSNCSASLLSREYTVNQWKKEKQRLWSEYQRTGDPAHLKAFHVHRDAMYVRLAVSKKAKYE